MKPWVRFFWVVFSFGLFLWLVRLATGAQEQLPVGVGAVRVRAIVIVPDIQPNGAPNAMTVTVHAQMVSRNLDGTVDAKDLQPVVFDLLANQGERVVVSGISREYRALALGIYAAALQEWRDSSATPPPLDEDRRAVRVK